MEVGGGGEGDGNGKVKRDGKEMTIDLLLGLARLSLFGGRIP